MKRMLDQKAIDFLNSLGDSLKYESSTNTFEVGTNLYVDGNIEFSGQYIKGGVWLDMGDSGYFYIQTQTDDSGDYIEFHIEPGDGTVHGLTDNNTKTLFGNQSIYGSGNIDLYRHQLQFKDGNSLYFAEIISSSNLKIDSLQDLTTLTKATSNFKIALYNEADAGANEILIYNGSIWEYDIAGEPPTFSTITDVVTTI